MAKDNGKEKPLAAVVLDYFSNGSAGPLEVGNAQVSRIGGQVMVVVPDAVAQVATQEAPADEKQLP